MAYATTTDIQNEFKSLDLSSSTTLTTAKVTQFLTDANAEIDCRLAPKYTVPITGSNALIIVKLICIYLVKHRCMEILRQSKTGTTSGEEDAQTNYRAMGLKMVDDIVKDKLILNDATLATPADGVRSYSNDNSDSVTNTFQRSTKQW